MFGWGPGLGESGPCPCPWPAPRALYLPLLAVGCLLEECTYHCPSEMHLHITEYTPFHLAQTNSSSLTVCVIGT